MTFETDIQQLGFIALITYLMGGVKELRADLASVRSELAEYRNSNSARV